MEFLFSKFCSRHSLPADLHFLFDNEDTAFYFLTGGRDFWVRTKVCGLRGQRMCV